MEILPRIPNNPKRLEIWSPPLGAEQRSIIQREGPLSRGKSGLDPFCFNIPGPVIPSLKRMTSFGSSQEFPEEYPSKIQSPVPNTWIVPIPAFLEAGFTSDSSSSGGSLPKGEQREFSQIPAITCSSKEEICHLFILSTSSRQLASRTSSSVTSWQDNAGGGNAGVSGGGRNG